MKMFDIVAESATPDKMETHIVHPEDLVFSEGVAGAQRAIAALTQLPQGKERVTIKWDGYPALVFGRNVDGDLSIMDKHMFTKNDSSAKVTSPEAFRSYDEARGADRTDLYDKIDLIWSALEIIIPHNFRGFYVGDLMYAGRPAPQGGTFVFKPNTVTYRVPATSATGKRIAASVAGIAVHTFVPGIGEADQPLQGLGGLPTTGPIWFTSGEIQVPRVALDNNIAAQATAILNKNAQAITDFMGELSVMKARAVLGAMSPYITAKIATGKFDHMLEGFYQYLPTRINAGLQNRLIGNGGGFLYTQGAAGLRGMFEVWVTVYNLKLSIKKQIDQQVIGDVQASVGAHPGHEGYVVGGGNEKMKLIDRLEFSRANFAKNG